MSTIETAIPNYLHRRALSALCATLLSVTLLTGCSDPSEGGVTESSSALTTVTDIEGNVYPTVALGTQVWTTVNLRTTTYNDGVKIPLVTDTAAWANLTTPAYCFYGNTTVAADKVKWGALYNGYAVELEKLAPVGWHVATDADWTQLQTYLIANGYNYDGSTTGNKIAKALAAAS